MSLQVKSLTKFARLPKSNHNGSFDIYSCETKTIQPNATINVKTGIVISAPIGYYCLIQSTELVTSHNIETSNFASIHYHNHRFSKNDFGVIINNNLIELVLTLRNHSTIKHQISAGDVIGRLVVVNTTIIQVRPVDKIEDEVRIDLISIPVVAVARSSKIWFVAKYLEDSASIRDEYFNQELNNKLIEIQNSEAVQEAQNKLVVEANLIWNEIPDDIRKIIQRDFSKDKARKIQAATIKKPKKKISMESSDENSE